MAGNCPEGLTRCVTVDDINSRNAGDLPDSVDGNVPERYPRRVTPDAWQSANAPGVVRYARITSICQPSGLGALLMLHITVLDTRRPRGRDGDNRQVLGIDRVVIVLAMAIGLTVSAARGGG